MARLTLDDALRALAVTLLFAAACESRAPIGPNRQPIQTGPCDDCHAAPPATGAHLAHTAPERSTASPTATCASSRTSRPAGRATSSAAGIATRSTRRRTRRTSARTACRTSCSRHRPAVTGDAIKFRNTPQAAWVPATGTCSGVYCHSSGHGSLDAPLDYVTTPAWTATTGPLGCDECHGNPPRYPSAGSESAAPNSHIQLASDGWEWGHYAGMPGPFHGTRHGDPATASAASPITCQTCHFATVDPSHTEPGRLLLPRHAAATTRSRAAPRGAGPNAGWLSTQCATCHLTPARLRPPAGAVLPLRHVNGRPDVVFDPRPTLPDGYVTGLPALVTPARSRRTM